MHKKIKGMKSLWYFTAEQTDHVDLVYAVFSVETNDIEVVEMHRIDLF